MDFCLIQRGDILMFSNFLTLRHLATIQFLDIFEDLFLESATDTIRNISIILKSNRLLLNFRRVEIV